jgi:hypothetical protein
MKFEDLKLEIERFKIQYEVFNSGKKLDIKFSESKYPHKCGKEGHGFRAHLPSEDEKDKKSNGIYCFLNQYHEVLYIGKATSNNMSSESHGKVRTPTIVDEENNIAEFEINYWHNINVSKDAKENILKGDFSIGYILIDSVDSADIVSKLEVYLQKVYMKLNDDRLPPLNSKVG